MTQGDETHFDQYLDQTQTKHRILRNYIKPFFSILKERHPNILFVDGFAGRGSYAGAGGTTVPGSPLIAIEVISSNPELAERILPVFIEARKDFVDDLKNAVAAHLKQFPIKKGPQILHDECETVLKRLAATENLAPTFLFVDPCGVEGVSLPLICKILNQPRCELFLFLNYAGLARITGFAAAKGASPTLKALLGDVEAQEVQKAFGEATEREREDILLSAVIRTLKEVGGAKFILPFRVEDRGSKRTSHYLIHATKHELGFKIMKDVMSEAGRLEHERVGRLELLQASLKAGSLLLVRPDLEEVKSSIVAELQKGRRLVGYFLDEIVLRPDNFTSQSAYRQLLLELEREGTIEVLEADGVTPAPAAGRRKSKGAPSLPPRLWVQLPRRG